MTVGSLRQRADQSLKTAFLLRSVLEPGRLRIQLPARQLAQQDESGKSDSAELRRHFLRLEFSVPKVGSLSQ